MNLRTGATIAVVAFISAYAYGVIQFNIGWRAGVKDLEQKMIQEAQAKLEKQITRQQADDVKASAAETAGKEKAEVITRDVIKYIKTPNRTICTFDDSRVRAKAASVDNANNIPGYDGEAMRSTTAGK